MMKASDSLFQVYSSPRSLIAMIFLKKTAMDILLYTQWLHLTYVSAMKASSMCSL